jgi:hypothetical protein
MRCWREYRDLSGAGLVGAAGVAGTVLSAGALFVVGLVSTIGSLILLIGALDDLADCLDRKGKNEEAARLRNRVAGLEDEVERLKQLLPDSYRQGDR